MQQSHFITLQPSEDIFSALRRWRATAPPGHRGNFCFRMPSRAELASPAEFRDEEQRDLNMTEGAPGKRLTAVQSSIDQIAEFLVHDESAPGLDCRPLEAALRRRA